MLIFSIFIAWTLLLATCAYRTGINIGVERLKASQAIAPAINYVNEILLPEPEDPRWEMHLMPWRLALGNVRVEVVGTRKRVRIGPLGNAIEWVADNDEAQAAYCEAVVDAWCNRQSMESIENADFPQKDPQLQLKGV